MPPQAAPLQQSPPEFLLPPAASPAPFACNLPTAKHAGNAGIGQSALKLDQAGSRARGAFAPAAFVRPFGWSEAPAATPREPHANMPKDQLGSGLSPLVERRPGGLGRVSVVSARRADREGTLFAHAARRHFEPPATSIAAPQSDQRDRRIAYLQPNSPRERLFHEGAPASGDAVIHSGRKRVEQLGALPGYAGQRPAGSPEDAWPVIGDWR